MRARTLTAALVLGLAWAAQARAGEGTPAVIVHPGGACTACEVLPSTRAKPYHENPLLKHRKPLPPMTVTLCPGACFGYFPTQWRSWEDACGPFPHGPAGPGVTPMIPPASDMLPWKNGSAPDPRTADPKKMKSMIAPLHVPGTRIN
jgi:hypothetical protein